MNQNVYTDPLTINEPTLTAKQLEQILSFNQTANHAHPFDQNPY
ncbi:hypothetical protein M2306_002691 [Myroides gitamensis]|nr:hypothetical protein [Myroides gitamensis]